MNFDQMDYDTFFKLAAIAGEPIDAVVSRVVSNAMFHEFDTSGFETPEFYQFYGKAMLVEYPHANTPEFYEIYGRRLLAERSAASGPLSQAAHEVYAKALLLERSGVGGLRSQEAYETYTTLLQLERSGAVGSPSEVPGKENKDI